MSDPRPLSRIVITGIGMVTSLGDSPEAVWKRVASGQCGFGPMPALEHAMPEGHTGAQAVDLPADFASELPREVRYLRYAILQALERAKLKIEGFPYAPERCGILLGTTLHGIRAGGQFFRSNDPAFLRDFLAGATLQRATSDLPFKADAATTCSARSSSLGSVALAMTMINANQLDVVIAGGYDATSEYAYGGFNSLRLVAPGPLRPFAKNRLGMKLGEGYGIVVLERDDDAYRRGVRGLARVQGWGESADAHHLTQPHPQGEGAAKAIASALASARMQPSDIDLIAAHATGTPDNDAAESAAIARTFGDTPVNVVAFKSHLGHTLGGAGAVELILSVMALREQMIPGCCNVAADEMEFDKLNVSLGPARPGKVRATLNSSLGFGGANTCVVLTPIEEGQAFWTSGCTPSVVHITGIGVLLPEAIGNDAFLARLSRPTPDAVRDVAGIPEDQYLHLLNARRVRRMSEYVKLTLAATAIALQQAGVTLPSESTDTWSAILGSTHGSASYCHDYYKQIVCEGLTAANPMLFAEGVPNAAAAHLSLMLGLRGACQTIIGSRTAGLDALRLASLRIATHQWDRAIVSAGEEFHSTVNLGYTACGLHNPAFGGVAFKDTKGFATGCGAVTLVLESAEAVRQRGARSLGIIRTTATGRIDQDDKVEQAVRVLRTLGTAPVTYSSANATWVDRFETTAIERAELQTDIRTLYGSWPELFSAAPLAAIAAGLLRADAAPDFNVLSTSYSGTFAGARIARQ